MINSGFDVRGWLCPLCEGELLVDLKTDGTLICVSCGGGWILELGWLHQRDPVAFYDRNGS